MYSNLRQQGIKSTQCMAKRKKKQSHKQTKKNAFKTTPGSAIIHTSKNSS